MRTRVIALSPFDFLLEQRFLPQNAIFLMVTSTHRRTIYRPLTYVYSSSIHTEDRPQGNMQETAKQVIYGLEKPIA